MNTQDNNNQAPNALDYIGTYLKKEDVSRPTIVTINDVRGLVIEGERKLVVCFDEFAKTLILNTTNINVLIEVFGTGATEHWRGKVNLFVDPRVMFGTKVVGGIRLQPVPNGAGRVASPAPGTHAMNDTDVPF